MAVRGEKCDDLHPAVAAGGTADPHLDSVPARRRTLASRRSPRPAGGCGDGVARRPAPPFSAPAFASLDTRVQPTATSLYSVRKVREDWRPRCLAGALESVC